MSAPNNPHNRAMDLVETAILERLRGNRAKTVQLYAEALELELVAIRELDERGERAEPTWSVLHRSAGWMAFNSHQFDMAAKLARKALAGNPHPEIAEELRDLQETINSRRTRRPSNKSFEELLDLQKETINWEATYAMQDEETMFHVIKSPRERRRDSAFDQLWHFDPAREEPLEVFNRDEQLEDMRTESPPQRVSKAKEFPSPTSEDIEPSQLSNSAERSIYVQRALERHLLSQRQVPRRHDGGSVNKFGLKLVV